jgi:hypothetical protein
MLCTGRVFLRFSKPCQVERIHCWHRLQLGRCSFPDENTVGHLSVPSLRWKETTVLQNHTELVRPRIGLALLRRINDPADTESSLGFKTEVF